MRYPEAGKVKSRLAGAVGSIEALRIYAGLLERTLGILTEFNRLRPDIPQFLLFYPPDKEALVRERYPGPWKPVPQEGGHLGRKMSGALHHVWDAGYGRGVLVGSDIADLGIADLEESFQALGYGKAVLGPASDGGFYLVGLDRSRPCPSAFEPQSWGTNDVFERTHRHLTSCGIPVHVLEERKDIDVVGDLQHLDASRMFRTRLSIVIPTLSPPERLRPLLVRLNSGVWPQDSIIVVQGLAAEGRSPVPMPLASPLDDLHGGNLRWVTAPRGRGLQLNRGVEESEGEILWFLHDDCLPPPHFGYLIRKAIGHPRVSLGCFRLAFYNSTAALDAVAWWANARAHWFKLPYGDQGIFCTREIFHAAGGFRKPFIMEDVDFVRSASKLGELSILPEPLHTSPERYYRKGILRACLQNHFLMLMYRMGMDDERIYSYYYSKPVFPIQRKADQL